MNKTTFDTRIDETVFDAVVAKGVRENGAVIDFDTLIVARRKLEDNIRTLVNDVCMEVIGDKSHKYTKAYRTGTGSQAQAYIIADVVKEKAVNKKIDTQRTKLATILEGSE